MGGGVGVTVRSPLHSEVPAVRITSWHSLLVSLIILFTYFVIIVYFIFYFYFENVQALSVNEFHFVFVFNFIIGIIFCIFFSFEHPWHSLFL